MSNLQWIITCLVSLIGGGACGAVLTMLYNHWRARQQPVLARIEVDRVFSSSLYDSDLQATVTVIKDGVQWPFSNLSLVKVELTNGGNLDRQTFDFGITLPNGQRIISCVGFGSDRHHTVACLSSPSLGNQTSKADFRCDPFNRKDSYTLKLYVTSDSRAIGRDDIHITSSAPVRITSLTNTEGFWATTLAETIVRVMVKH